MSLSRVLISLFLIFLLLFESIPSHALIKVSPKDLESNPEKAKSLSETLFDGKKPQSPGVSPSTVVLLPAMKNPRSLLLAGLAEDRLIDACRKGQSIHGGSCKITPLDIPDKKRDGSSGFSGRSYEYPDSSKEQRKREFEERAQVCGAWSAVFTSKSASQCAQEQAKSCDFTHESRLDLNPQEINAIKEDCEKRREAYAQRYAQEKAQRQHDYDSLSSAGKFGFWSTIVLSLAILTGGAALAGYFGALAAGSTHAGIIAGFAGLGGLALGSLFASLSYDSPGSFHEALGTTLLSPLALSYGILSGLLSTLSFGLVSPSWGNSDSQRGSKVLHQLHRASKTATQVTTILGGAALGLGVLGVPGLATASVLVGTPIAATAGLYTGTSLLVQTGRLGYRKLIQEPRERKDDELYQETRRIHWANRDLESKIEDIRKDFVHLGINDKAVSLKQFSAPSLPQSWDKLSPYQKLSYQKDLRSYQDSLIKTIQYLETHLEPYRRQDLTQALQSKKQALQEYQTYFQEDNKDIQNFLSRIDQVSAQRQSQSLNDLSQLNNLLDEIIQKESQRYRQSQEAHRKKHLKNSSLNEETYPNETLKTLKKDFGNNFWQNSEIVHSLEPQNKEDLKSLDLRYDLSLGPFDKEGKPLLGSLYETAVSYDAPQNEVTNTIKVQEPPFVIPSKTLHIIQSPQGNPRVPGAANADGTTHKGIDIGSDWGPKEGFGLPVGLGFITLVVGARKQAIDGTDIETGYGKLAMLLNFESYRSDETRREFWILAHGGEHDKRLTPQEREKLSGILVEPGEFVLPYHPIIIFGESGNAYTAGKRRTPQPQLHIEKIVVTDRATVEKIDDLMNKAFAIQLDEELKQKNEKQWKKNKENAWTEVYSKVIDWRKKQSSKGKKPLDPLEGYR